MGEQRPVAAAPSEPAVLAPVEGCAGCYRYAGTLESTRARIALLEGRHARSRFTVPTDRYDEQLAAQRTRLGNWSRAFAGHLVVVHGAEVQS
jgi:hypothetical protein